MYYNFKFWNLFEFGKTSLKRHFLDRFNASRVRRQLRCRLMEVQRRRPDESVRC